MTKSARIKIIKRSEAAAAAQPGIKFKNEEPQFCARQSERAWADIVKGWARETRLRKQREQTAALRFLFGAAAS